MKNLIAFLMLIGILSCNPERESQSQKLESEVTMQLAQQLMELWETGDTLKTSSIFLDNCEYVDMANNTTFSGIDGVNRYVSHIHKWASDVKMNIRNVNVSENMGYVEWTMTARHTSPIEGKVLIATNKDISLNGVTVFDLEGSKIKKASDYMDVLGFVIQLGSKLELPGGVTIGE